MRLLFAGVFSVLLLTLAHIPAIAQGPTPVGTTQARVLLTLKDAGGQPVGGTEVQFLSEQQVALASCVTDGAGRCTMALSNAPADASGFIRGSLQIEGRGRRPVIWPGSDFPLTITLDAAGQLGVPVDVYVTRTPAAPPSPASAATVPAVGSPALHGATPSHTAPDVAGSAPTATSAATTAPVPAQDGRDFWLLLALLGSTLGGIVLVSLYVVRKEPRS